MRWLRPPRWPWPGGEGRPAQPDKGAAAEGEAKDLTEKLHAVRGEVEALTLASEKQTAEMHEAARAATAAAASATAHIESLQKQVADVDACADGACSGSI